MARRLGNNLVIDLFAPSQGYKSIGCCHIFNDSMISVFCGCSDRSNQVLGNSYKSIRGNFCTSNGIYIGYIHQKNEL